MNLTPRSPRAKPRTRTGRQIDALVRSVLPVVLICLVIGALPTLAQKTKFDPRISLSYRQTDNVTVIVSRFSKADSQRSEDL